jgi:hypothetical protein
MMGHDTAQPFPHALLRIQLGRVGRLGLPQQPVARFPDDGLDGRPCMLLASVMDHQEPLPWIARPQVRQERRTLPLAQLGAEMIMSPARQRGHCPIDRHFGMVVARRDLRDVVHHTPLGGQRRVPADRRLIHQDQFPVLGPLRQQLRQRRDEDRWLLRLGLEVAVAQPTPPKPECVPQLAHALPARHHTKTPIQAVDSFVRFLGAWITESTRCLSVW